MMALSRFAHDVELTEGAERCCVIHGCGFVRRIRNVGVAGLPATVIVEVINYEQGLMRMLIMGDD